MGLKIKKAGVDITQQVLAESNDMELSPGNAIVTIDHPDKSVTTETVQVAAPEVGDTVYVSFGFGQTRNMGNYESSRFYVGIVLPCKPTLEDIEETYAQASAWVDSKVSEISDQIASASGA